MPTLLLLAAQIGDAGLQSVPMNLFYGIIVAHGLFFGTAYGVRNAIFKGMANIAISIGNDWQGVVAECMGYAVVLYLDALFAVLVILVIPLLRDREAQPAMARVMAEPLLAGE